MPAKPKSIFTHLLFTFAVTALAVGLLVGAAHRLGRSQHWHGFIERQMEQYLTYIVRDLEEVHALDQKGFARSLGWEIGFVGADGSWQGNAPPLRRHLLAPGKDLAPGRVKFVWQGPQSYLLYQSTKGLYYFRGARPETESWRQGAIFAVLALVPVVLLLAYLRLKRLWSPLSKLDQGMEEIQQGNLTHRIPPQGPKELVKLAETYNQMSGRIGQMLRDKEQLLSDVSHELRSPLTRMQVVLALMEEGNAKHDLQEEVACMAGLVTGILEAQRMQAKALHPVSIDLAELAPTRLLKQGLAPSQLEAAGDCRLWTDAPALELLLDNLLSNAVKYSPGKQNQVRLRVQGSDSQVLLEVVDFGMGIAPDDLPRIFEPFYRADQARCHAQPGYGLGLHLVKRICQALGGSVTLSSQLGLGTQVQVLLPKLGVSPQKA